jgi:uncharacterized membrane protein YuzA (DUF378 family)
MAKMGIDGWLIYVLVSIGSLAWGIYGVTRFIGSGTGFMLVDFLAHWSWLANVIYVIVGLAGLWALVKIPMLARRR